MPSRKTLSIGLALAALAAPVQAEDAEVPYWASIRTTATEVNMRVGPAEDYRIAWVYRRPQLPMKVIRIKEGWRLVQDPGGSQGWMLSRFLTRDRTAIVAGKQPAEMRAEADTAAKVNWRAAVGVIGLLGDCEEGWCEFTVGKRKGFVRQEQLWGAGNP
jgi:SH3-like domain-containing protein